MDFTLRVLTGPVVEVLEHPEIEEDDTRMDVHHVAVFLDDELVYAGVDSHVSTMRMLNDIIGDLIVNEKKPQVDR